MNFNNKLNSISRGLSIQKNVIDALVYRELKTRISQVRFGIFGVFIEPLGVMIVFLLIFSFLRGDKGSYDIALFLTSGIVLYTLFNDIAIRSLNAISANEALFYYKPVKPIDTVIARSIVEFCLYLIVYLTLTCFIFIYRETVILDDIFLLLSTYISLTITGFGFGLIIMVLGFKFTILNQIVPLLLRPFWFISGVFFSLSDLPYWLRPYLSWNPILQAIELSRYSFSKDYILDNQLISINYLICFALFTTTFGLWLYRINEKSLLTR